MYEEKEQEGGGGREEEEQSVQTLFQKKNKGRKSESFVIQCRCGLSGIFAGRRVELSCPVAKGFFFLKQIKKQTKEEREREKKWREMESRRH